MSTQCTSAILWMVFRALDTGSRRLLVWPRLLVLVFLDPQKRELLMNDQARLRMRQQVRASESLECASLIVHFSNARLPTIPEVMVSNLVSVLARCLALLLVFLFLLLLLCLVFAPCVVLCLHQLCHACPWMIHPCMLHTIRGRTRVGFRVPREGGEPKVGVPVRPKICALSQHSAGRRCTEAGCRFNLWTATRHRNQTRWWLCGDTFYPSGSSSYPSCVTWTRKGIRQLNGLVEGVWYHQVGNLGAKRWHQNSPSGGMEEAGSHETAWVTPGHNCLCPYKNGHGAGVRPQTNYAIWDGVIGLWSTVAPLLSP